jgi:hypothetical protein
LDAKTGKARELTILAGTARRLSGSTGGQGPAGTRVFVFLPSQKALMSSNKELDDYIGFDVSSDLKRKAREAARRDGRKLSNYMRYVLRLTLAAEGGSEEEDDRREAVPA